MKCFTFDLNEMQNAVEQFAHTKAGEVFIQRESTPGAVLIDSTAECVTDVAKYNGLDIVTSVCVGDCNAVKNKLHQKFADFKIDPHFDYFEVSENEAVDALFNEAINYHKGVGY